MPEMSCYADRNRRYSFQVTSEGKYILGATNAMGRIQVNTREVRHLRHSRQSRSHFKRCACDRTLAAKSALFFFIGMPFSK